MVVHAVHKPCRIAAVAVLDVEVWWVAQVLRDSTIGWRLLLIQLWEVLISNTLPAEEGEGGGGGLQLLISLFGGEKGNEVVNPRSPGPHHRRLAVCRLSWVLPFGYVATWL